MSFRKIVMLLASISLLAGTLTLNTACSDKSEKKLENTEEALDRTRKEKKAQEESLKNKINQAKAEIEALQKQQAEDKAAAAARIAGLEEELAAIPNPDELIAQGQEVAKLQADMLSLQEIYNEHLVELQAEKAMFEQEKEAEQQNIDRIEALANGKLNQNIIKRKELQRLEEFLSDRAKEIRIADAQLKEAGQQLAKDIAAAQEAEAKTKALLGENGNADFLYNAAKEGLVIPVLVQYVTTDIAQMDLRSIRDLVKSYNQSKKYKNVSEFTLSDEELNERIRTTAQRRMKRLENSRDAMVEPDVQTIQSGWLSTIVDVFLIEAEASKILELREKLVANQNNVYAVVEPVRQLELSGKMKIYNIDGKVINDFRLGKVLTEEVDFSKIDLRDVQTYALAEDEGQLYSCVTLTAECLEQMEDSGLLNRVVKWSDNMPEGKNGVVNKAKDIVEFSKRTTAKAMLKQQLEASVANLKTIIAKKKEDAKAFANFRPNRSKIREQFKGRSWFQRQTDGISNAISAYKVSSNDPIDGVEFIADIELSFDISVHVEHANANYLPVRKKFFANKGLNPDINKLQEVTSFGDRDAPELVDQGRFSSSYFAPIEPFDVITSLNKIHTHESMLKALTELLAALK